jgi:hypothetical protein
MNGNTQEEKHDQLDDMPVSAILHHALADKRGCAIPRKAIRGCSSCERTA